MFIYNIKVNGNKLFKMILIALGIIAIIVTIFVFIRIFYSNGEFKVSDSVPHSDITKISADNYSSILKATHENIDAYIGKQLKFSGYVYRVLDFNDNQFVLARDMVIDASSFVIGFLCEYDKIADFEDGCWIEITGTIAKGTYHNQVIPIVKINSLNKINKPEEPFVAPPEKTYIPTSSML